MREMIDEHEAAAKASGARITFSCGFDSIPFDLGVLFLQAEAVKRHGKPAPRVKGRVRKMAGGASGGTIASLTETLKAIAQKPSLAPLLKSRSEERRVGKECVSRGRTSWSRYIKKKKKTN